MPDQEWDQSVDVLVVGSGAGGMLAALTAAHRGAKVLLIEKSSEYGGTSATSGGGIWIPNSHHAAAAGQQDSAQEAFTYIRALSAANVPDANIRAYIDWAPRMLEWLERHTRVTYMALPYPDYHAELPGGKAAGFRTHLPGELDGRLLGGDMNQMRTASPAASLFGLINWRFTETYALLFRPRGWWITLARMFLRYAGDLGQRLRSRKDRFLTLGTTLAGGLRLALKERAVPLSLRSPVVELLTAGGAVTGAVVLQDGRRQLIEARQGVILAAGGFERNAEMRQRYLQQKEPRLSGSQINNTGDTIRAAQAIGAGVMNMHSTWAGPVFSVPSEERGRLSTIERALPGCIMVHQGGRRYLNEAASYHIVGQKMLTMDQPGAGTVPSWVIFDHRFRHKYPMGPVVPLLPDWLQSGGVRKTLKKAATIEGLARAIGAPPEALARTVAQFNADARIGVDTQFGRGSGAYDRMYGDASVTPNPCLAPIVKPPFYAFPIYPGDIGTNGGLMTDEYARVLTSEGKVIPGLYATGNNAASVMGESYPGAGATLGPAMTFGFVAALHVTGALHSATTGEGEEN